MKASHDRLENHWQKASQGKKETQVFLACHLGKESHWCEASQSGLETHNR